MQKSAPFIGSGLSELRNALSTPGDQLYQQLTDLILALDEAGGGGDRNGEKNESPRQDLIGRRFPPGAAPAVVNMMDTSGPSRRKVRRKRRRRRSATLPVNHSWTTFINHGAGAGGNNSVSHPSATEFCVSHSPIHGTSDSSLDVHAAASAKNLLMDISDSDMERLANKAGAAVANAVVQSKSSGDWFQFRAPNKHPPVYPDASMLSPMWISAPVESDSFTETVTPARHSHHRRKRLIKRMAIDTPAGELAIFDDSRNRHNNSMDVDASPRHTRITLLSNGPKPGGSYSEHSIEYDARSCISASDTDDGNCSSDDGRQGDDELSDWCLECSIDGTANPGDECMGVPNLKQSMRLSSAKALNIESSDTDMSQSSFSQPSRRLLSKGGASLCGALNRRIVQFLRDPTETELSLGELRKKERKEAVKLAMFYHLDIRRAATLGCRYHILCKTKYSRWVD